MKKILYNSGLIYCVLFTLTTIFSSIIQLTILSAEFDSNAHILNRAVVVLIGTCAFQLVRQANFKFKPFNVIVPYCISMGIVFLYVYIAGFFEELHPNAYRDIFLNYTVIFIIVTVITTIYDHLKNRKSSS